MDALSLNDRLASIRSGRTPRSATEGGTRSWKGWWVRWVGEVEGWRGGGGEGSEGCIDRA